MVPYMFVDKHDEAGYWAAMYGLALNKGQDPQHVANSVAPRLAHYDGGHNKFLESIMVWLSVIAPRYWWQEADTYRIATKQSESTMHTILRDLKDPLLDPCELFEVAPLPGVLEYLKDAAERADLAYLKTHLPEGFLQERMWCLSYKTLRNIVHQREDHRLPHWRLFCESVRTQIDHPEFIWDQGE